jgi:SAM-dependent methyltransferase
VTRSLAPRTTAADLAWWLDLAADESRLAWRWAVTYAADSPHWYVIRNRQLADEEFERAVRVIRTFGQPGKFHRSTMIYLVDPAAGIKWWTMGAPVPLTTVINRATTERTYGVQNAPRTALADPDQSDEWTQVYDELATGYDARYDNPQAHAENAEVRRLVVEHFGAYAPTVLDVGCGTGLVLDLALTAPGLYTGIDPSQAMLNELVRKHPKVTRLYPGRAEDVLLPTPPDAATVDLAVALFGVASYLAPEVLDNLVARVRWGGMAVFMHYTDGYLPDYHRHVPPHYHSSRDHARELMAGMPAAEFRRIGQFDVTVLR